MQKFALSLALYGWFAVIALYLHGQLNFSLPDTDFYFSLFAAFNVVVNVGGVGRASTRFGDRTMSNIGLACLVLAFVMVPLVHHTITLAALMALFGIGMAFASNGLTALISNTASPREQGTVLGVSSSLDSLSGIVAPPLSTGLLGSLGSGYAGSASTVFAVIAFLLGLRRSSDREEQPAQGEAQPAES